MAAIRFKDGKWRAEIRRQGVYRSGSFRTKAEAQRWAFELERDVEDKRVGAQTRQTLRDALERYQREETPKKRGFRNESLRIDKYLRELDFIKKPLADVTADDWARWRDKMCRALEPSSVTRDLTIIRAMYSTACGEWGWLRDNPMRKVKNPPKKPPRENVWGWLGIRAQLRALNWAPGREPIQGRQQVAVGFLLALETGMRAGEVFGLADDRVNLARRFVRLELTKNGTAREVPLSKRAARLLGSLPGTPEGKTFKPSVESADALFRKYKPAHLKHLTFHDARHTAATRLGSAGKLTPFELCRMFGWQNMSQALAYFNATATDIAAKLD